MILFPNSKINIGLHIIRKRSDGYHDLESLFYPIPLKDVIEIFPSNHFQLKISGLTIPGDERHNLCVRAYQLLKKVFPEIPSVSIYLHKNIPLGSGLGGGSSDGAFMLTLLNDAFQLNLSAEQLLEYATQLGSDCPFFILNKPSFVRGRGELLEPFPVNLSDYSIALINPGIHINTEWAFSKVKPHQPKKSLKEIIKQPLTSWPSELVNDFEEPVFKEYPALKNIKQELYDSGALYASMTGSGSSLYGIFNKNVIPSFSFEPNFRIDILK